MRMYNYYKIDKILGNHVGQIKISVHDFQSKKYVNVVLCGDDNEIYILFEEGTKYRVIGISKEFPSAHFQLEGQPAVLLTSRNFDFMANRLSEIQEVSDIFYCNKDAEGNDTQQPFLDSWLITEKSDMNNDTINAV